MRRSRAVAAVALAALLWPSLAGAGDLRVLDQEGHPAYRVEEHDIGDGWSVFDEDGRRVGTIEPDAVGDGYSIWNRDGERVGRVERQAPSEDGFDPGSGRWGHYDRDRPGGDKWGAFGRERD